jgi:hypothetical protein
MLRHKPILNGKGIGFNACPMHWQRPTIANKAKIRERLLQYHRPFGINRRPDSENEIEVAVTNFSYFEDFVIMKN